MPPVPSAPSAPNAPPVPAARPPASPFFAMMRRELAPTPRRVKLAIRTGAACSVTLAIAFWLQSSMSDLAGLFPIMLLSPMATCTWRNLFQRISWLVVSAIVAIFFVGVLVDLPWAMLPVGFAVVTAGLVIAPLVKKPIVFQSILTVIATVMLLGTLNPNEITSSALESSGALLIALIVCTLFARVWWPQDPERTLAEHLSTAFDDSRTRLNTTIDAYCRGGAMPPPDYDFTPGLAGSVMTIENAARSKDASLRSLSRRNAMLTIAQRVANAVHEFQEMSALALPDEMRVLLTPRLRALQEKFDRGLRIYAARAAQGFSDARTDPKLLARERASWPDFSGDLEALSNAWREMTARPSTSADERAIRLHFSAAISALDELAMEIVTSPVQAKASTIVQHATEEEIERAPKHLPVTRAEFSTAMKGGLATMIAFTIVLASGHAGYITATWTALLLVQTSYGAIVRKSILRLIGGLVGGALAILVMLAVYPNADGPFLYLIVTAIVCFLADYGGRSSQQISYGFMQMGISYLICVAALGPTADTDQPLDRLAGIMIGIFATFVCYAFLARDYASNQLLRELAAMLRPSAGLIPRAGRPLPERQNVIDIERRRILHTTNVLRLADEVVFEGKGGKIDTRAALRVSSYARRVTAHACGIGYIRAEAVFRAPPDKLGDALRSLEDALREWLTDVWQLIDTTEKQGQPNSRRRRHGRRSIERMVRRPLPPLEPLLQDLMDAHATGLAALREWDPSEWEALAAEMVHVSRLVTLLPELRKSTVEMLLPGREKARKTEPVLARA